MCGGGIGYFASPVLPHWQALSSLGIGPGGIVDAKSLSSYLCCCLFSGISYIAPHLNNLYFLSLCRRWGVYAVVRGLFFLKLALSVVMLLAGPDQVYLLCIFIARYAHNACFPCSLAAGKGRDLSQFPRGKCSQGHTKALWLPALVSPSDSSQLRSSQC